jgi:hypothetical protein
MYQLVYVSQATCAFSQASLDEVLLLSRRNNKIKGVTGMLVFYNGQFLQVLEGNPSDVIGTYDRIASDPRHDNLLVLHRGYSSVGKTFAASAMGFHSMAVQETVAKRDPLQLDFFQFDGLAALNFLLACRSHADESREITSA